MAKGDADYLEYRRTRTAQPPATLHKYTSAEVARLILSTGKMRFQSPLRYNDPFDSQWDPMWNLRTPEALEFTKHLIRKAIENPNSWPGNTDPEFRAALLGARTGIYDLPLANREDAIRELVDDVADSRELHEKIDAKLLDLRTRLRVLCLSANPESVSMWSHYADQHRGVVLTFDTSMLENGLKRPVQEVLYEDSPPVVFDLEIWSRSIIFGLPEPEFPEDPNIWTRTKSPEWIQEQEWRITTLAPRGTPGDYEDFDIPKRSLVEVTLGCRTDPEVTRELVALARPFGAQMEFSQLYMPIGSFSLAKRNLSFTDDL